MYKACYALLLLYAVNSWGQSPGGIRKFSSWIKHDPVQHDLFLPGRIAEDKLPHEELLNFNTTLPFRKQNKFPLLQTDLSQATIFTVYHENDTTVEHPVWKLNGDFGSIRLSTRRISADDGLIPFNGSGSRSAIIHTYLKYGRKEVFNDTFGQELSIGQPDDQLACFPGKIAEFVVYDRVLKASEQQKIETYLAIKYGISLHHDYISSDDTVRWSFKNNGKYNHNIVGIGRDDNAALYQKQSAYSEDSLLLIVGAGKIAPSNLENKATINDNDFLILGNDNKELVMENAEEAAQRVPTLKRHWAMNVSGATASTISTELSVDISKIFPGRLNAGKFILAIDRSGEGNFSPAGTEYFTADKLSNEGILTFKNIYWDTDRSGKDIFSFGLKPLIESSLTNTGESTEKIFLYPNPSSDGHFNLIVQLEKPGSFQVDIFDANGRRVQTISRDHLANYLVRGRIAVSAGVYTFLIRTTRGQTARRLVIQ